MILPVLKSTHTANSSVPFGFAVLNQIRFPSDTGEDHARPCTAVFHATFSVSDHFSGSSAFPGTFPIPVGPRNSGQFGVKAIAVSTIIPSNTNNGARVMIASVANQLFLAMRPLNAETFGDSFVHSAHFFGG